MDNKAVLKIGFINIASNEDAPPLNLVYLASALKSHGFCDVKIIDPTFKKINLSKEIQGLDCVGISAMTKYYRQAMVMAAQIKKIAHIPVIIGGSHITTVADSLGPDFDLGVIGEAEQAIVLLAQILQRRGSFIPEDLRQIHGLVYRDKAALYRTADAQLISNLDSIPLPDYSLLDVNYFKKKWIIWDQKMGRSMKIITSRGCPYNCIFCASKKIWKIVRLHSAERIFQEVKMLADKWGVDHIYIDDDLFIIDKPRLKKFAELMENTVFSRKISFFCSVRSSLLDETTCEILQKIGVKVVNFGFESGSDRLLKYLKGADISVQEHKKAIALCNKYGLKIWGSFMLASPTETIEEMEETSRFIDFAVDNGCQRLGVFIATPLPGTEFWKIACQRGSVNNNMNWDLVDYANSSQPLLLDEQIDPEKFRRLFNAVKAKADRLLFKDNGYRMVIFRSKKAFNLLVREPKRVFYLLRGLFHFNAHT